MTQRYIPSRWNLGYDIYHYWRVNFQCMNTVTIRGIPLGATEYKSVQVSLADLQRYKLSPDNAFAEWFRLEGELLLLTGTGVEVIICGEVWKYAGDLVDIGMPIITSPTRVTSNSTRRAYIAGELIFGETVDVSEKVDGDRMCHSMLSLVFDRSERTIHGPFMPRKITTYKNRAGVIGHVCRVYEGDSMLGGDFKPVSTFINDNAVPALSERYFVEIDGVRMPFRLSQRFGPDGGYAQCLTAQCMYVVLRTVSALEDERLGGFHRSFVDYMMDEGVLEREGSAYVFKCKPTDLQAAVASERLAKFKDKPIVAFDLGSNITQHCMIKMNQEKASSDLFGLSRAFHVSSESLEDSPTGGALCFNMTDKTGKFMECYLYFYEKDENTSIATVPGVCALLSDAFMLAYELANKGCMVDISALQAYMFIAMFYCGWVGVGADNEVVPLIGFESNANSVPLTCFDLPYATEKDRRFTIQRTAIGTAHSSPVCHRKMTVEVQCPEGNNTSKAPGALRKHAYVVSKEGYVLYDPISFLEKGVRTEAEYGELIHPNVGLPYKIAFGVGSDNTAKGAECQVFIGKLSKNTFVSEGDNHFVGRIDSDAFSFDNHSVEEV